VYTHVNRKMIHVGTIPRMGEEGNKGEWWLFGGVHSSMIIWYIVWTFVNATMYACPAQQ
jgi:hypothetical protein